MEPKRAILYARVSRDDRTNEGRNLRGQLEMCRSHALSKGWRVIAELAENDRGANSARLDLPQLNQIIELARGGAFDVLVVRELDRLSRSLPKQLFLEDLLLKAGVHIEYVIGAYPDTPEGMFMKNVRAAVAELERLKIRERNERGKLLAVKAGNVRVAANAPYGYTLVEIEGKSILRIREDEAKIIHLIFAWYSQGDDDGARLSLEEIAHRLTEMGVPTYAESRQDFKGKVKFPGKWNYGSIVGLIKSTVYKGEWRYGKTRMLDGREVRTAPTEQVMIHVPAIVDEVIWDAAQAKLKENQHQGQRFRKCTFLLSGHIWCDLCGTRVFGGTNKGGKRYTRNYRYYYCGGRSHKFYGNHCHAPTYHAGEVDNVVWEWITLVMADSEMWKNRLTLYQEHWNEQLEPLYGQLEEHDEKIRAKETQSQHLLDLYLNSNLSKKNWEIRSDALHVELRELTRARARLHVEVATYKVNEQQIQLVQKHGKRILALIDQEEDNLDLKRQMLDMLNVRVKLCVSPEGNRYVTATCLFGEETLPLVDKYQSRKSLQVRNSLLGPQ